MIPRSAVYLESQFLVPIFCLLDIGHSDIIDAFYTVLIIDMWNFMVYEPQFFAEIHERLSKQKGSVVQCQV